MHDIRDHTKFGPSSGNLLVATATTGGGTGGGPGGGYVTGITDNLTGIPG